MEKNLHPFVLETNKESSCRGGGEVGADEDTTWRLKVFPCNDP